MKSVSYAFLIPAAVLLAILPLGEQPHLVEKVAMLRAGSLSRPIDIFDLIMHGGLLGILALKVLMDLRVRLLPSAGNEDDRPPRSP
jgi:hypothetical protein